ncbi:MAG: NAD-dependent epimerase/dehydratase family protein [Planctomycetota bacterium]
MTQHTYLVTGVAGLIGSHVAEALVARGDSVVGVDNFNDYYDVRQKRNNVAALLDGPRFTLFETDFRDAPAVNTLVADHRPHAIAHLGAMANVRYSIGRAPLYHDVNISGSLNLLEAAIAHGNPNFVFASTSSVYGHTKQLPFVETDVCDRPLAPYPASKRAVELLGHSYHNLHELPFTALRFFSVYGPRARPDMMPFMVTDRIARGDTIKLFNAGQMKRDWTYVDDIAAGVVAALDTPSDYEIINIGRGEPVLMADFVQIVEELIGKKAILDTPPAPASEPEITFANVDKAKALLNYEPTTDVRTGLEKLWAWYQSRGA